MNIESCNVNRNSLHGIKEEKKYFIINQSLFLLDIQYLKSHSQLSDLHL